LDADEAKGLLKASPDLRLRVSYGPGGDESIRIESVSPQIEPLVKWNETAQQIEVFGKSFSLVAQVLPSLSQTNQFPDQAFVMLDANTDGFLDENEIPEAALQEYSFDDIDRDDNGKLTIEEIRNGLAGEEPIWFIQVRARGAESPDAVFGWLDQNRDNFLSTREILRAPDLLHTLAVDGIVKPASIPDTYLLQFGRGDPNQDEQLFGMTPTRSKSTDLRPRWAQAMDSNGDGDISRDEFTSTDDHFEAIDDNQDGFIDPQETTSP
jgi:Ca2+-binding EF-hand superfamily protein